MTTSAARESSAAPEVRGLLAHPLQLVGRVVAEDAAGGVGDRVDDDQVAQPLEQVLGEPARVVAALDDPVDDAEDRGRVAGREGVDGVVEQAGVGVAEQRSGTGVGQALVTGAGEQLVEDGERVAHRAAPARTTSESTAVSTATFSCSQTLARWACSSPGGTSRNG